MWGEIRSWWCVCPSPTRSRNIRAAVEPTDAIGPSPGGSPLIPGQRLIVGAAGDRRVLLGFARGHLNAAEALAGLDAVQHPKAPVVAGAQVAPGQLRAGVVAERGRALTDAEGGIVGAARVDAGLPARRRRPLDHRLHGLAGHHDVEEVERQRAGLEPRLAIGLDEERREQVEMQVAADRRAAKPETPGLFGVVDAGVRVVQRDPGRADQEIGGRLGQAHATLLWAGAFGCSCRKPGARMVSPGFSLVAMSGKLGRAFAVLGS